MFIFGIKNLKREYIRLRNENQILKIEAETERIWKEYWKAERIKIEKEIKSKNELIEMLRELPGVTIFHAEEKSRFDIKIKKNSAIFIIE